MLKSDQRLPSGTNKQRQCGRKPGAGATPANADPLPVNAKLFGLTVQPVKGRITIFQRPRIACLRCKPIIDRYDDATQGVRIGGMGRPVHIGGAHDIASTMNMKDACGKARDAFGPEDNNPDLWPVRMAFDPDFLRFDRLAFGCGWPSGGQMTNRFESFSRQRHRRKHAEHWP